MAADSPAVYVHIGAMKTGTTYLQQLMAGNRDALAGAGVLFPGQTWAEQARAAHDVLRLRRGRRYRPASAGMWPRLSGQMLAHRGRASVLSVEFLSFAGARAARRLVDGLSGAEVHVVLTVRDTAAVLPALWQTSAFNGGTASWPAFARGARAGAGRGAVAMALGQGARMFRDALDVPRFLEVWGPLVPAGRLHVVTVPPPGSPPRLLWDRFASVLGVDPAVCSEPPRQHNPSLGYASADLLRRVNAEVGRLHRDDYDPTVKQYLARDVLAGRSFLEPRPPVDEETASFAAGWNARVRAAVERSGAHLVGSLAELPDALPDEPPRGNRPELGVPTQQASLDAALAAMAALDLLVQERSDRLRRRGGDPEPAEATLPTEAQELLARWEAAADPVRAATADVTALVGTAVSLRRQVQAVRRGGQGSRPGR